jgi:glycosyltransferase involved in cell wall biosynthesis
MKILYHHRTQAEDGQAVHIRSMLRAFRAIGQEVEEIALVRRGDGTQAPAGTQVAEGKRGWNLWSSLPRFVRELAEYGYTASARRMIRARGREWRPDVVYERYAFGNAGGLQAARALGVPLVLEVNSPMVLELSRTRGLSFPGLARRMEDHVFRSADIICAVSGVLADMLVEMGVERSRILVTPNGVDLPDFDHPNPAGARVSLGLEEPNGRRGEGPAGPVLGFVGYLRDWHRLDLVVEAMVRPALLGAHLVIIGEGPAVPALEEQARSLGLADRLHLSGSRPHGEIPALLPAFDVGLVPAINPYASPLKLHEYMAASLAVIAPDQPNLREVLTDGRDALLVPPGDGEALAEALERLALTQGLGARLGAAARRTVEDRDLTWEGNARRVCDAVENLP